jgi:hypothetical protein
VYLIFSLIDSLSFSPVSSAVDADHVVAVNESNGENAAVDHAETEVPQFARAMGLIFRDDAP